MARAVDFESTKKNTAKGDCAAKRVRLTASRPYRGEIPSINRSTWACVSLKENPWVPSARFETANSRPRISASVSRTTSDSSMTKISFIQLSAAIRGGTHRLCNRHVNEKSGSFSNCTFNGDETAVLLNDLMGHRETQSTAFIFTRKERVENVLQIVFGNSYACVPDFNLDKFADGICPSPGNRTRGNAERTTFLHCLDCV